MNKLNYWVENYGFIPSQQADDFSDRRFIGFVNKTYLKLLEGEMAPVYEFKRNGFNYDPAIKNSMEFYFANQKHLRSLAIMGGAQ